MIEQNIKHKTMKTNKLFNVMLLLLSLVIITACVEDDDFQLPDLTIAEPEFGANDQIIGINAVAGELAQEQGGAINYDDETTTVTFETLDSGGSQFVEAYVISSDEAGNFFEEIILQDALENPTVGIKLLIDVNPLFTRYEVGRKLYIKLDGLSAGITNGVLSLGKLNGNEVDKIASAEELDHILRSAEVGTLVPMPIALNMLTNDMTNLYVDLQDVQFSRTQVLGDNPQTFASEPSDEFDGERSLESCSDNASVVFSTSTFADFKSLQLPVDRGSMNAILTKNFFGDEFNIVINSTADINFDNEVRCDPDVLSCDGATSTTTILFEEDFQSITNESQLDALGWTNINVSGGSERFEDSSFSGDRYMKISAFGTGEDPLEAWLVTPAINLDSTTQELLSVDISANFETGQILTPFITNNFTGDVTTTEWTQLDINIPIGDSGFGDFVTLTTNISCLDGDVHVAFKYLGADGGAETRYHVDDVRITGM